MLEIAQVSPIVNDPEFKSTHFSAATGLNFTNLALVLKTKKHLTRRKIWFGIFDEGNATTQLSNLQIGETVIQMTQFHDFPRSSTFHDRSNFWLSNAQDTSETENITDDEPIAVNVSTGANAQARCFSPLRINCECESISWSFPELKRLFDGGQFLVFLAVYSESPAGREFRHYTPHGF